VQRILITTSQCFVDLQNLRSFGRRRNKAKKEEARAILAFNFQSWQQLEVVARLATSSVFTRLFFYISFGKETIIAVIPKEKIFLEGFLKEHDGEMNILT